MRILSIIVLAVLVSACGTTPPKLEPVIQYQLVTKSVPSELLEIPSYPTTPDLNGSQKDVAVWIIENEKRVVELENKINNIKKYVNE